MEKGFFLSQLPSLLSEEGRLTAFLRLPPSPSTDHRLEKSFHSGFDPSLSLSADAHELSSPAGALIQARLHGSPGLHRSQAAQDVTGRDQENVGPSFGATLRLRPSIACVLSAFGPRTPVSKADGPLSPAFRSRANRCNASSVSSPCSLAANIWRALRMGLDDPKPISVWRESPDHGVDPN